MLFGIMQTYVFSECC